MPDISMRPDEACPRATSCYRSPKSGTRPSKPQQVWFTASPRQKGDRCTWYDPRKAKIEAGKDRTNG